MVKEKLLERFVLLIFPLIFLLKDHVFSLSEKGVKAVVLGPGSSDTETKDPSEGKYNLAFTKSVRFQIGFEFRSRI